MVSSFSPKMALILAFTSNKNNRLKNPAIRSYRRVPCNWVARKSFKGLRREDMAAYLEAALEEGDPALVAAAMGDIARAKGITQIARETGLGHESLYKALSPEGNPEFATVLKVVRALGLRFHATAV
jgi:probable addiction module antidote protein